MPNAAVPAAAAISALAVADKAPPFSSAASVCAAVSSSGGAVSPCSAASEFSTYLNFVVFSAEDFAPAEFEDFLEAAFADLPEDDFVVADFDLAVVCLVADCFAVLGSGSEPKAKLSTAARQLPPEHTDKEIMFL